MGKKEEMLDDAVAAYEESTGQLPDTRDYVELENAVDRWVQEEEK